MLEEHIEYGKVNEIIQKEQKRSLKWIEDAIETPKEDLPSIILPQNISTLLSTPQCTGCGACAEVCPVHAIQMHVDDQGFLRPIVDNTKCTYCGLCGKDVLS